MCLSDAPHPHIMGITCHLSPRLLILHVKEGKSTMGTTSKTWKNKQRQCAWTDRCRFWCAPKQLDMWQTKAKKLELTNKQGRFLSGTIDNTSNISNWNGRNKDDGLASGWFPKTKFCAKIIVHEDYHSKQDGKWKNIATISHIGAHSNILFYLTFWLTKSKMHQLTCVQKL